VRSPTQLDLGPDDVAAMVRTAFGPRSGVREAAELTGGGFATVWRVGLTDGRDVVLKVGPPPEARLLGYERGMIACEAAYFRLVRERAPGVPVPDVLHHDDGWLITTLLPGRPLTDRAHDGHPDGDAPVRAQVGAAIAAVHAVTGPHFGYTGDRPAAADWPTAFGAILDALRADADAWDVPLPPLDGLVERHAATLAEVSRPALVHFDLWDGNVLADESRQLTGLVDGERYLYGDPLIDFVSPALFRRIEDEPDHPFLRGYASVTPLRLDESARTRLALYRVFLYVLMLAEGPSRAIPVGGERHDGITALLRGELDRL
jgi:aminoglycoside phosphotransferase (APT) family kinase protein